MRGPRRPVTAVRARGLDRGACDLLADRCVAAAARRELAGHLPCVHICGAKRLSRSQAPMLAAGWCWCLSVVNGSIVVLLAQPSSLVVLVLVCEVGCAGWHALQRQPAAPADVACSASGFGQLVLHVENGLLEIFLLVCGSSTPAWSCQDERRQQTSCAAAAGMAEWRARGSCTTARLHSNPSIALTPALADSFRLCEAAAPMAGGGDAGDDGGDARRASGTRHDQRLVRHRAAADDGGA